jgi:Mrp family chromosome partitioning ATPase
LPSSIKRQWGKTTTVVKFGIDMTTEGKKAFLLDADAHGNL